jgi:hypothetical protein
MKNSGRHQAIARRRDASGLISDGSQSQTGLGLQPLSRMRFRYPLYPPLCCGARL